MIKLIAPFVLLLIIAAIVWAAFPDYEKCYKNMDSKGYASYGRCRGLSGGTKATIYLSEMCCSCPYLTLECNPIRKEDKIFNKLAELAKEEGVLLDYYINRDNAMIITVFAEHSDYIVINALQFSDDDIIKSTKDVIRRAKND